MLVQFSLSLQFPSHCILSADILSSEVIWEKTDGEKGKGRKCPSDLMVICFCQKSLSDRLFQTWFSWLNSSFLTVSSFYPWRIVCDSSLEFPSLARCIAGTSLFHSNWRHCDKIFPRYCGQEVFEQRSSSMSTMRWRLFDRVNVQLATVAEVDFSILF